MLDALPNVGLGQIEDRYPSEKCPSGAFASAVPTSTWGPRNAGFEHVNWSGWRIAANCGLLLGETFSNCQRVGAEVEVTGLCSNPYVLPFIR